MSFLQLIWWLQFVLRFLYYICVVSFSGKSVLIVKYINVILLHLLIYSRLTSCCTPSIKKISKLLPSVLHGCAALEQLHERTVAPHVSRGKHTYTASGRGQDKYIKLRCIFCCSELWLLVLRQWVNASYVHRCGLSRFSLGASGGSGSMGYRVMTDFVFDKLYFQNIFK